MADLDLVALDVRFELLGDEVARLHHGDLFDVHGTQVGGGGIAQGTAQFRDVEQLHFQSVARAKHPIDIGLFDYVLIITARPIYGAALPRFRRSDHLAIARSPSSIYSRVDILITAEFLRGVRQYCSREKLNIHGRSGLHE